MTLPTILAVACGPAVLEGCRIAAERALAVLRIVPTAEAFSSDGRHPAPLAVVMPNLVAADVGPDVRGRLSGAELIRVDESLAAHQVEAIVTAAAARAARRRLSGEGRYSIVNPPEEPPAFGRSSPSSSGTPIARVRTKRGERS